MARQLRIEIPDGVYHVTGRGNARQDIFLDDEDRKRFLDLLKDVNQRFNWLCHGYCLMDNHFHLIVETLDGNLCRGMRQLGGVYTQRFNRRHDRVGHLFQGRYKAILVQKESYLLELCRYVVLNPLRAGMVDSTGAWPWSSYRATVGEERPHACFSAEWILQQFGQGRIAAQQAFGRFVADGQGGPSVWEELTAQVFLGNDTFVEQFRDRLNEQEKVSEIPRNQRLLGRPSLADLFARIPAGDREQRNLTIGEAIEKYGYSQREVADHQGLHYSTVSRLLKGLVKEKGQG